MAFTDDEKLEQIKRLFNQRINEVPTLAAMVQLIRNISPAGIKAFLMSNIEAARQDRLSDAARDTEFAAALDALKSDVGAL